MILLFSMTASKTLFDFNKTSDIQGWSIVDDVVMGGRSNGSFGLNSEGHGEFKGHISLENNGGFSSLRYTFKKMTVESNTKAVILLKGDGKTFQFRIKTNSDDYYSYIAEFKTSGSWEEIEIPLKNMYPSFRGQRLDKPNFSDASIEEITFLVGNKKNENFELLLAKIELK